MDATAPALSAGIKWSDPFSEMTRSCPLSVGWPLGRLLKPSFTRSADRHARRGETGGCRRASAVRLMFAFRKSFYGPPGGFAGERRTGCGDGDESSPFRVRVQSAGALLPSQQALAASGPRSIFSRSQASAIYVTRTLLLFRTYIGGRWYTFDARNNVPRIGRVLIALGRDAADVPITQTFGPNTLVSFKVWTDEVV